MSSTFQIYAPAIGRLQALRQAMLKALDGASTPRLTHPAFWGAFVVVGDGGPAR
jgi:CHAT domain-containing protein